MPYKKGFIISIVILGIVLTLYFVLTGQTSKNTVEEDNTNLQEIQNNNEEIALLKTMTEKERIQRYLGNYIMNLESGNYEKAYDTLYQEFKDNYFKSFEKYKDYVSKLYPAVIVLEYIDAQRQGEYFILYTNIIDALRSRRSILAKICSCRKWI